MARSTSDKTARTGNGANLGFEEKLWQAADKLRGQVDASEYKHIVPASGSRVLLPRIDQVIDPQAIIYSDQWGAYRSLNRRDFAHASVNHESGEYARGNVHTNTIEGGVWSHFKKSLEAIYVGVSAKHLDKYCAEFGHRYNRRNLNDGQRFTEWFGYCAGHLAYKALIAD